MAKRTKADTDLPRRLTWSSPESGGRNIGWDDIQPFAQSARIVAVAWNDAHIVTSNQAPRDIDHRPVVCITVGVLVHVDESGVSLAMSINDAGDVRASAFIPRGMVIEQWEIGPLLTKKKTAGRGA